MKKIMSMILCCCMLFGLMSTSAFAAGKEDALERVVAQGTCGTVTELGKEYANTWQLTAGGVLAIVGGTNSRKVPIAMPNYSADDSTPAPWSAYAARIKAVRISGYLPNIGENAFRGCSNLTIINLTDKIETIGRSAFYGCTSLETIKIPASVEVIQECAFEEGGLRKITIQGMDTVIEDYAFNLTGIKPLIFCYRNSKAYQFAAAAHYDFVVLDTDTEPEVVAIGTCGSDTFPPEGALRFNIWTLYDNGLLKIYGQDKIAMPDYSADWSNPSPWKDYSNRIIEVTMENVLSIGAGAFATCENLETITIPDTVKKIGEEAFYGCGSLEAIMIPETVESIGAYAFDFCEALESVTIRRKEMSLGGEIFEGCPNVVIYCLSGSDIATYASENGIKYELLDAETPETTPVTEVFSDVYTAWYTEYIQYVFDNGLMTGIQGTSRFEPNTNITKAQVAQVLYNIEGQPAVTDRKVFAELKDVNEGAWYANAVAWAYNNGVVTGDTSTMQFLPGADVTREQLALMMYRYAKYKGYDASATSDLAGLVNADKVSSWAKEGVKWAVGEGLISGIEAGGVKDLAPQGNASRSQMAAILQRFCVNNHIF